MRSVASTLLFFLVLTSTVLAQSPTDGYIEGNSYFNTYFHISYSWPDFLHAIDTKSLALSQVSPNGYEYLLFAAKRGNDPSGAIVLAEKLNVPTAHSNGFKGGADFLDRAFRSFDHAGKPQILARKHFTNPEGIMFDQIDYLMFGEYTSGIAAQIGDFLIVFKFNARSASDLEQMTQSAIALHRTDR